MTSYTHHQTLNDIRWWTGMPVALRVGGNIVQVRARGSVILTVTDAARLSAQVANPDDLNSILTPQINAAAIDALGELSQAAANLTQLTTITSANSKVFTTNIDNKLATWGVQVNRLTIEAIESV
ncbi:MAG: SPFH domain-containing protein [Anaerolineae bacterium]